MPKAGQNMHRRPGGHPVIRSEEDLVHRDPQQAAWLLLRATLVVPMWKLERELMSAGSVGHQARCLEEALAMWEADEPHALVSALVRLLNSVLTAEVQP